LQKEFNIPVVLIAPLDWGLGHVTRCIPIIKAFKQLNWHVIVATNVTGKALLQKEFANVEFAELKGYRIRYSKNASQFFWKILLQVPKIFVAVWQEHKWLKVFIRKRKISLIISDNRFGFCSDEIKSVFITHQLRIKLQFGWMESLLQQINYHHIKKFDCCWIPDVEGANNLSGELSHPVKYPAVPIHYLGLLSRFGKQNSIEKKYDYCIILSGPEPQRTVLEKKILKDIYRANKKFLLVRGKPNNLQEMPGDNNVIIKNHLTGNDLQLAMEQSDYVVSRSGYTTVMEILSLQKKSVLIPTPGQTEQEYLGKKLHQQQLCFCIDQKNFDLIDAIESASGFNYNTIQLNIFDKEKLNSLLQNL
jgi:spore coat polysaccharide biosynthesis predicted glycosyltransferase SpsG